MQRLSYLDAQFLHLEDTSSPMHIANIAIFEGPAPSRDDIERLFESKLPRLKRYRQRVRTVPLELGRPVWVDDPRFYLRYHVRRTALPEPHDYAALCQLMGRLMSQLLDRDRPLWEVWIVEGMQNGHWAMISKSHHAMVDGVNGTDLLSIIMDKDPDATLLEPIPWSPQPEPSNFELMRDAWRGTAEDWAMRGKAVFQDLKHPRQALRTARDTNRGIVALVRQLLTTPSISLQGQVGPHRSYAPARASLAEVQLIRKAFGGTVNDVVLAAVTAGHRALLANRGEDPDRAVVRSLVPVAVKGTGGQALFGNRVSAIFCDLPVHVTDPVERLHGISAEMKRHKSSFMVEAGAYLTTMGDLLPAVWTGPSTRLSVWLSHFFPQRSVSTVTTNVPGPREPLYCLGRKMVESFPYVPIAQGSRVGTAVTSYDGQLGFGVTADYDTVPDIGVFVNAIESDITELVNRARGKAIELPRIPQDTTVRSVPTAS